MTTRLWFSLDEHKQFHKTPTQQDKATTVMDQDKDETIIQTEMTKYLHSG